MEFFNSKEKIEKLKKINDYMVIIDFDRTITTRDSESSVGVIPEFIGGECLEKRTKNYNYYRPMELDYSLPPEKRKIVMREWAIKSFSLISEYVTQEIVKETVKTANLHLRQYVKEFLYNMYNKNIPVVIMSAGVGNIIEEFLKKEDAFYENITIVSNFYEFKENKAYINIDKIIATSNKDYSKIPENLRKQINDKNKILLFGDIVEDINMINKEQLYKTITIGFLDYNIQENLERYNKNFDIVIADENSFELIIKNII